MKIVTEQEMRKIDKACSEQFGIPPSILMERAGLSVVLAIEQELGDITNSSFLVLCGPGNNGGDGFVVARDLLEYTDYVTTVLVGDEAKLSEESLTNLSRLRAIGADVRKLGNDVTLNELAELVKSADVVVDALLGVGIKGEVRDPIAEVMKLVNLYSRYVVSVDVPSGLETDTGAILGIAIKADMTVTFGLPKLCHVLYPGRELCGKLKVASIGIPRFLRESKQITRQIITKQMVKKILPRRVKDSHKGSYGKVLVIAGSRDYPGAAVLTSIAALRVGCGYLQLLTCSPVDVMAIAKEPGIVAHAVNHDHFIKEDSQIALKMMENADAIVIGPGMTCNSDTSEFFERIMANLTKPVVIDADGLNCLAQNLQILRKVSVPIVLTPHPGEFARLVGKNIDEVRYNYKLAEEFANKYNVTVVLKSATTLISTVDGMFFNLTGNTSLSKAGTGDVLAGMIVGMIAQGVDAKNASVCAVYLHGLSAEHYSSSEGTMLTSELLDLIPYAIKEVES
ncbi:bifunctional ADP-dependent NAD(P)H-hydrate dehydratase/NAD(P)H-hydrate epimerase [Thermotoga profunda]|uniref:bifunctional ADP-dependent NAD(P)H-hydrate dehydratase/NAD(P)H-hydrate epimerase n=1 Tax=Thermotoga profunda TaxID=1508420 RepID=UPI000596D047|nr:bifunctional ADP-dependent NAD(P)H-hydrate dehydratase/NAD(P)H-hydrate epimerase [Thermotoga profunda]